MNQLGVKCVMSMRTAKEVERHLQTSDEEYRNMGDVPDYRREKLLKYVGDELIREYWMQLHTKPALKWTAFVGRLRSFSTILRKRHSIGIDKRIYDQVSSNSQFDELSKIIREGNPEKSPEVVEHDCFHLLLIDYLRSEMSDEVIIPKCWFLTIDKTLSIVEKVRMIYEKKRPATVLPNIWLQMMSSFLSPKIAAKEVLEIFSNCFSPEFVPSFPKIRPAFLSKLIGPCLDHTDLDMNEIMQLVGDTYLQEHFQNMGDKKVERYLTNKLLDIREKTHKREMQQSEEDRRLLEMKVARLEEERKGILEKSDTGEHLGRYLAGGSVFLVVWIITYIFILLPTIGNPIIACSFSILISLIFGYLVGFKRYEWILERFADFVGAIQGT